MDLDSLHCEVESLKVRVGELERAHRLTEERVDTLWTPPWKKLWFWVNGWPLYRLADAPKPRPWHRWTGF